jgi:DNA polymerase-3 subunit epsilon
MGMREIVLDTETTGLEPTDGHRIVEIGCVELVNHVPTGRVFHHYVNPGRAIDVGAQAVSGITDEMLLDKAPFSSIVGDFLAFIDDAPIVIHNAAFDIAFLNIELKLAGLPPIYAERAIDTLAIAKRKFPGAPASLDALCRRYSIDLAVRDKHGALVDAQLLAQVYLELIGGRQTNLGLIEDAIAASAITILQHHRQVARPEPLLPLLTPDEAAAHAAFIKSLRGEVMWAY